eukprot:257414-Pyramimonas_sp.AAC.1
MDRFWINSYCVLLNIQPYMLVGTLRILCRGPCATKRYKSSPAGCALGCLAPGEDIGLGPYSSPRLGFLRVRPGSSPSCFHHHPCLPICYMPLVSMRWLLFITVVAWASQAHTSNALKLAAELRVAAIVRWPLPGVTRRLFSSPLPLPPP